MTICFIFAIMLILYRVLVLEIIYRYSSYCSKTRLHVEHFPTLMHIFRVNYICLHDLPQAWFHLSSCHSIHKSMSRSRAVDKHSPSKWSRCPCQQDSRVGNNHSRMLCTSLHNSSLTYKFTSPPTHIFLILSQ